jgi:6-phosphofructokinase 1
MPTAQAILRRAVDVEELALFESLGVCFGRKPVPYEPELAAVTLPLPRHL